VIDLYTWEAEMRTNIVIDDQLMKEALELSGLRTKKAAVEAGLRLLVKFSQQSKVKNLRGKLKWSGDLDRMRTDK
jgi:Arc/MetJ family transcription regulator